MKKRYEMKNELLLIPDKADRERDSIAAVWEKEGGEVLRVGKFWVKPETNGKRVSIYGYDSFCLVLAQILEIEMLMPKDEMIAELPSRFIKREIEIKTVEELGGIDYPKFVKPVTPKLFKAEIFNSEEEFNSNIVDIDKSEKLICSEVIPVNKEVRSFILDNEIQDLAFYEGTGDIEGAKTFIEDFLETNKFEMPKTFVLDVGFNGKSGWFVIEFNSSWGAGLNFCDPNKVLNCIREASVNP